MSRKKRCWHCRREMKPNEQTVKIMGQQVCPKCVRELVKGIRR